MICNCIDVSSYQGNVDWTRLPSNINYAIVKATQGHGISMPELYLFEDSKFKRNIIGAHDKGLKCGVYHYFTARTTSDVNEQIDYFVSRIQPYKGYIDTYAALDVEDPTYISPLDAKTLTNLTMLALERIQNAGFQTILYTNPNFLKYKFTPNVFDDYPVWLAHYGVASPYKIPNMKIWQFGELNINGFGGVDANYFYPSPENKAEMHVACCRQP